MSLAAERHPPGYTAMNNTYYNISREGGDMGESPIIPVYPAQNGPRSRQSSHSAAGPNGPELDKWKSRVPKTGNSALVPKPLFSSAKCVVDMEPTNTMTSEVSALSTEAAPGTGTMASVSPINTATPTTITTTADPTPISPSPSAFPIPPSAAGFTASPVHVVSPVTLHASDSVVSRSSVYSQSTIGNATAAAARPRPVSSIYSQNTMATMTVTAAPSPQTPTMTSWASTLPGLSISGAETQAGANTYMHPYPHPYLQQPQAHHPAHMEQAAAAAAAEEIPAPLQYMQLQIQVPRLRSPSLPQDRGGNNNRRRTISSAAQHANTRVPSGGGLTGQPLVRSPERVSYPETSLAAAAGANYDGSDWPLRRPSDMRSVSRGSYHVANKESVSSILAHHPTITTTTTTTAAAEADVAVMAVASPRASLADSHTPICGPGEQQRSGWWSDDDDVEQQRGGRNGGSGGGGGRGDARYAAVGSKEKPAAGAQRRSRTIKLAAGVSVLLVLVIVGVAVGVTLGTR